MESTGDSALIDKLWIEFKDKPWDLENCNCGHLCARWVGLHGREVSVEGLTEAKAAYLTQRLGKPAKRRDGPHRGDVVLVEDGTLGIWLGYCLLTMIEERGLARIEVPSGAKMVAWASR